MRTLLRLVSLLALLAIVPGLREMLEQGGHYMVSGHSSHASQHPEGAAGSNDEDGCAGATHICQCCRIPIVASLIVGASTSRAAVAKISSIPWVLSKGFASPVLRPPLA